MGNQGTHIFQYDFQLEKKSMADVPQYKHEKEIVCITGGEDMLYTSSGKRTITAWNTIDNSKREFKVTRYHKINAK